MPSAIALAVGIAALVASFALFIAWRRDERRRRRSREYLSRIR